MAYAETLLTLLISSILLSGIYIILGLGLNLLYGTLRVLNIAHGDLIMLGAYSTYWLSRLYGIDPFVSIPIVAASLAFVGFVIYRSIFHRLVRKVRSLDVLNNMSLLIFFGILIIIDSLASLLWSTDTRAVATSATNIRLFQQAYSTTQFLSFLAVISVSIVLYLYLKVTYFGKAITVVIQDREAAQLVGVNLDRVYMACFCISAALAGIGGTAISTIYSITPYMGLPYTMLAFVVVILGGLGSIKGTILSGLVLALTQTYGAFFTSPGLSLAILYTIFIAALLIRPRGIFGTF